MVTARPTPPTHYLGAQMNRKIGRRTGMALGALLGAVALGLTWFAFQVSMDAVRAMPDFGAVASPGHNCR
ncbi:hypothetical protein Slala02_59550 [Streptomyces lavendulae subsp. lavendulae]|nr:hypothetical protein Slala01_62960 [Streptomyces lavendulae subsp. lavendulae]GLX30135.1 hypothetical protein Slala02_59550 [Streptomyces lavendulae subsp. lavendulae]